MFYGSFVCIFLRKIFLPEILAISTFIQSAQWVRNRIHCVPPPVTSLPWFGTAPLHVIRVGGSPGPPINSLLVLGDTLHSSGPSKNKLGNAYPILDTRISALWLCVSMTLSRSGHSPWILKRDGLETSVQRPISINRKTKKISFYVFFFSILQKCKQINKNYKSFVNLKKKSDF